MKQRLWAIACILAATAILCFPLLRWGLPRGHDSLEHVQWYACFSRQLWQGDLFPRWLTSMNAGLGSPSLFVYGPLPYYGTSFLSLLRFWPSANPETLDLGVSVWIITALSALGMYAWLRTMVGRSGSLVGALVYLIVPYHLDIDLYTRSAVPELWSFGWIPLTLFFTHRAIHRRSSWAIGGVAISYALLVTTHLVATVIFTPVLLAYGLYLALCLTEAGKRSSAIVRFAAGLALGVGLSAAYTLPALEHEKNISASRYIEARSNSLYVNHFLFAGPERSLGEENDQFLRKLSWWTISSVAASVAAFVWLLSIPTRRHRPEWLWIAVALGGLAMMLPVTNSIWKASPSLQAIQFPWRYNILLVLATAALTALAVESMRTTWRSWRIVLIAGIAGIVCVWAALDLKAAAQFSILRPDVKNLAVGDYLIPSWARWTEERFMTRDGLIGLSQDPSLLPVSGGRDASFESDLSNSQWVTLKRLYYPGWHAETRGGQSLPIRPASGTGLIQVEAPAGNNKIDLILPWSLAEKIGLSISMASILAVCSLLLVRFGVSKPSRA